ncbi:NYN domain-containing protein [bacterium]|nr:NYN domain-containing protein [bacterium]
MPIDRSAVFIDAGYLEKVLEKEFGKPKIHFGKLVEQLACGKELLRAYYYNCPPYQSNPPTDDEMARKASADKFYAALRRLPRFEIRLGRLEKRGCQSCGKLHFQQKRADLMLGVDLVNLSAKQQISRAVIVAGDSDFLPAIHAAKDSGVLVHLFHGGKLNPPHDDLYDACDDRTLIDLVLINKVKWI